MLRTLVIVSILLLVGVFGLHSSAETQGEVNQLDIETLIELDAAGFPLPGDEAVPLESVPRPKPRPDWKDRPGTTPVGPGLPFDPLSLTPHPEYRSPKLTPRFAAEGADSNCQRYIKADGTYGKQGLLIRKEILGLGLSSPMSEYYLTRELPGIQNICPKYYSLQPEQRINWWIWYMAAISWDESKCYDEDWRVNPNGTDTVAAGEFQMPAPWKKHREWRGPGCNGPHEKVDGYVMVNPDNNIPCAVQTLSYSLCGFYSWNKERCQSNAKAPWGAHHYWRGTKRSKFSGVVATRAMEFPLCK